MASVTYEKDITGLLVIDPYNDFISEGGKVWDRVKDVAEANQMQVLDAARKADVRVFYALHYASAIVSTNDVVGAHSSLKD